jgi:hypothetical protein
MDRCEQCGFVYDEHEAGAIAADLASVAPRCRTFLDPPHDDSRWDRALRTRPVPDVWSALEYACHIRDVFLAQRERLFLTLVEDRPSFTPIYRDQRVGLAHYDLEEPVRLATEIEVAAKLIARAFAGLDASQWQRPCVYNYPAPAERTLVWLGQHTVHEGEHHLADMEAAMSQSTPRDR